MPQVSCTLFGCLLALKISEDHGPPTKQGWLFNKRCFYIIFLNINYFLTEMCSERDSPLKRLYRRTHAKLTRLAGSGQLVWAAGCELSLALVHARRPAWPGETSETILRVAPPRKTRPPDHTRVNWPVDASASGSAQVGPGGRHRWAARVQVGQEPARQKAREGYPSHYTSLFLRKGYRGDLSSCTGQPRLGYLNLMCGPPRPPTSPCHQPRKRPRPRPRPRPAGVSGCLQPPPPPPPPQLKSHYRYPYNSYNSFFKLKFIMCIPKPSLGLSIFGSYHDLK